MLCKSTWYGSGLGHGTFDLLRCPSLTHRDTRYDVRSVKLTTGVFWVQLHGISPLNMTGAAMKKIGGLLGSILEVDQVDGEDCVWCFARVRVMMDIEQLFKRGAFVEFPKEGSKWINFCYEYILEYCFFCGCLGHLSRTCVEKTKGALASDSGVEALRAYAGLEALEDIYGRPLKSVMRRTQPQSSFGTWKEAAMREFQPGGMQTRCGSWEHSSFTGLVRYKLHNNGEDFMKAEGGGGV
ncbi:unnamed protein product [Prunus armeniaca]|uniref:CCHC-type domain-containing protein n=1 Tax=Prunus armeniaca TaxID=36596 RepID=A0A6J5VDV8_PRUAR|nr:unnamed protein product [Prunus armeniaca]